VVVPTRVGGVETARVEAVLDLIPRKLPAGLVISSARTYTRDYQEVVDGWTEANVAVWGTIPERVSIATGPEGTLASDGIDAYRTVWRRALRAGARSLTPSDPLARDLTPRRSRTGPRRSAKLSTLEPLARRRVDAGRVHAAFEPRDRIATTFHVREVRREHAHLRAGVRDRPARVLVRVGRHPHLALHVLARFHLQILQARLVLAEGLVRESSDRIHPGTHVAPSSITPIRKAG